MRNGLLTKADFVRAANILEVKGHIKNSYGNEEGDPPGHCGAGALGQAAFKDPGGLYSRHFPEAVSEVLEDDSSTSESAIIHFNDRPDTSKEDVQNLLLLLGEIAGS